MSTSEEGFSVFVSTAPAAATPVSSLDSVPIVQGSTTAALRGSAWLATQPANNVTITGGTIDGVVITNSTVTATIVQVGATAVAGGVSGRVLFDNGGTLGEYTTTGNGTVVLSNSPTLVTPNLGIPSALALTNATGTPASIGLVNGTGLPLASGVSGNLSVTHLAGGSGATSSTFWRGDGTWASPLVAGTTLQAAPADPTGTASATAVMMGLAQSITPIRSGKVLIVISGTANNNNAAGGGAIQIRTGTGSAPVNGAALTGTQRGTIQQFIENGTGSSPVPFSVNAVVTGLTLSTAIWIDLAVAQGGGLGVVSVTAVSVSVVEL